MHKIPLSFFVEQRNHEPDQKSTPKKDQHYGAMQEKILCSNLVVHSKSTMYVQTQSLIIIFSLH